MTDAERIASLEARLARIEAHIEGLQDALDNTSGLERGHHLDLVAINAAILSIVTALDDKLPAVRDLIAMELEERLHKAFDNHPSITSGEFAPPFDLLVNIAPRR